MNRIIACLSLAMLLVTGAVSQDEFIPDKGQTPAKEEPKKDDPEKELKEKIKKYDDFLKDTTKLDGPFTLYTKKKDGKTDVFLELDPAQLGKYWFLEATLRTGGNAMGLQAGEPANTMMNVDAYRFERRAEQIWLVVPNLSWRWDRDSPWATAARRSFPEGVIDEYKIEAEHPTTKKMVIKMTDLFYGGVFDLNERVSGTMMRPYILDRGKSGVSDVRAFPENIVVRADLFFNSPSRGGGMPEGLADLLGLGRKSHLADDRSLPLGVTYLIYPQRDNGYVPRIADPRVGYFTQDFFDHSKLMELDKTTRYINRWNLEKKDPNAGMSEPVKPIVWYIDDSVPEKYRKACAEGILRWNKAFEKVGYKNAVQVKMKPKDADWDHADMRFNVLRVIQSEDAGYAVAWFRTDPFTGEIVNAGISLDASMISFAGQEYTWLTAPARGAYSASLAKLVHKADETPIAKPGPWKKLECHLGEGKLESAAFAWSALETLIQPGTSLNKGEYLNEFLVDVVSHEAGHCMGLR
nr:DUF5117 domain-containing protein [Armatimonadota bacterium]